LELTGPMHGPTALINAAIFNGAERIMSGRNDEASGAYRDTFRRSDDEHLFRELLHQFTRYDSPNHDQFWEA
jgi:hypothetical protein